MKWILIMWSLGTHMGTTHHITFNNPEACLGAIAAIQETHKKRWTAVPDMICVPQGN